MADAIDDELDLGSVVPPQRRTSKLGIVGAGAVGSTMAYAALMRGAARTVALLDVNKQKVEAEVLDLSHGIQFMSMAEVVGSDDVSVLADCDIVVFTAGAKQRPGSPGSTWPRRRSPSCATCCRASSRSRRTRRTSW